MDLIPASRFTIDQLTHAYNQTRIDYLVPMPMSAHRLQEYVDTYDVDLDASVVAMDGEEMLGLCMLAVREGRSWITRLGVLPTARRRGSGEAMMEYVIAQSDERKLPLIQLEVIVGNEPAHKLFVKLGFEDVRRLLILRRPPGTPPANHHPPNARARWLETDKALERAATRPWSPAWTNQTESLRNASGVEALSVEESSTGRGGWVTFQKTALQLKRIIIGPDTGSPVAPAYNLLHHLHTRFPTLDTIAENIPVDALHLDAFYAHGYVESFARIEMERRI